MASDHMNQMADAILNKAIADKQNRAFGDDLSNLFGNAELDRSFQMDLAPLAEPKGAFGVPLGLNGDNTSQGLLWDLRKLQGHAVTFGATRSGKGVCSIIPALLSYAGSMVVIDPKGENAWATAERRRQMGQRVVILDPWGEVNRRYGAKASPPVTEQTTRFNPLSFIDPDSEDFADDVNAIADALVIPGGMEAHWTDSARELISGLVAARVQLEPGKAHLGTVRKAVTSGSDELRDLVAGIIETAPDSLAARKLRRFAGSTDNKEVTSIRSTAETQTAILDSRRLVESMMTGDPPFNLEDLARTRCTLYLVLPLDRLQTHGRWLRLILTMAIRAIAKQDTQPTVPVLFLLDEMGTIGSLTMVEQAFGLMAGIGVRIWAFLQDINQLQRDYPRSWETFISNASIVQALKISDSTTSRYLSDLMGTRTLERVSGDTMQQRKKTPELTTMSDQQHSRALMLPQEIRMMRPDRVLNIVPGIANFMLYRTAYYAPDSLWKGLYRSPPWFAAANAAAPPSPPPPPPKKKGFFS